MLPDPIRYAELRTAREWGIPINEWDGLPVETQMEMMAHIDVADKIDSFIRHQREAHRKSKRPKKGLELREGR